MSSTHGTAKMTKAEYNDLSPKMKGYACYMFGAWSEAGEWLKSCPFDKDKQSMEHGFFMQGEFAAMLEAMECDD